MSHLSAFFTFYTIGRAGIGTFGGLVALLCTVVNVYPLTNSTEYAYLRSFYKRTCSFFFEDNHERDGQLDSHQYYTTIPWDTHTFVTVGTFDSHTSHLFCLIRATANGMSELYIKSVLLVLTWHLTRKGRFMTYRHSARTWEYRDPWVIQRLSSAPGSVLRSPAIPPWHSYVAVCR